MEGRLPDTPMEEAQKQLAVKNTVDKARVYRQQEVAGQWRLKDGGWALWSAENPEEWTFINLSHEFIAQHGKFKKSV